ncbi:MAG: hypothetical protein Q4G71_07680 [Pseudomonadota bacterium]|nr:hypothetical protein [Pseudomonadota bacterium]
MAILLLLALGWGVRFADLGQQSLWEDELFSADIIVSRPLLAAPGQPWLERSTLSQVKPGDTFWTVKGADQSPPLFELVGKLTTRVFGEGELGLRMTSALSAALLLLWLALRAWRWRAAPEGTVYLTVLALMASSALLVFYAQEARAYSLGMVLATVLVVKFWERLVQGWRQAPLPGWGEVALAAAACMAHYNALVLTGLLFVAYALEAVRRRHWSALARMSLVAVVVLAWLGVGYMGFDSAAQGHIGWVPPMSYMQALRLVMESLAARAMGYPFVALLALLVGVGLAVALVGVWRAHPADAQAATRRRHIGALAVMVLLLLVYLMISGYVVHKSRIENVRHLVFALPVVFIVAGAVVNMVSAGRQWVAVLLVMALTATQVPALKTAHAVQKGDYRGAAAFVLQRLQDGDTVVVGQMANALGAHGYYLNARSGRAMQTRLLNGVEAIAAMCADMANQPRWGVVSSTHHTDLFNTLENTCGSSGWRIERFQAPGVLAQVWTRQVP